MSTLFREQPFYHSTVKNIIIAVGNLFTGVTIIRRNEDGTVNQEIEVPIAYGPRNKWLSRLKEDPDLKNNVEITLPRLAFEITDYRYDASRKIGTAGNYVVGTVGDARAKLFNPVPYDIYINLYSMCKTQEESLQILEQILPYFAPALTVSIEILPTFKIQKDVPILLQSTAVEDTYDGTPDQFRTVVQTFTLVAQADLFGPINLNRNIIKETIVDINTNSVTQQIPNAAYDAKVNPITAKKTDPFTIDESWSEF